ncbi:inorganic pyrophosphatase [Roseivivax marinus]|uniref:inorganic diphosphatase n=1 Tax=Roseivivax marinus TaxID=1379903 RepID=W4HJ99_9RHOB|nr:inorganic diphosphatase [Roseivivax marinus]ETW12789.1 inorganic pyrophosphatase [Roseivivax marinus]UMA64661.1 inorganic diphosphatase [Roseivivax marinus]
MFSTAIESVPSRTEDGAVNVFIETPKGSRHKYDLDSSGLFRIGLELPEGVTFPFSFGFVPNTLAEDGDALDIMLVTAGSVPSGALIESRLIGVLKMENDEDGKMARNDRVVAVANMSRIFGGTTTLSEMRDGFAWDLEEFFDTYNRMIERPFRIVGRGEKDEAMDMLEKAEARKREA